MRGSTLWHYKLELTGAHQVNENVCGSANAGTMPRPNIPGYHHVVYQSTQSETIYFTCRFIRGGFREESPFILLYFQSSFWQYCREGEREGENMWPKIQAKWWLDNYLLLCFIWRRIFENIIRTHLIVSHCLPRISSLNVISESKTFPQNQGV